MIAISLLLVAGLGWKSPTDVANAVVTDKYAYILQEPMSIATGKALQSEWRADGKKLLLLMEEKENGQMIRTSPQILVWDRATNRARSMWTAKEPASFADSITWLGNTNRFVAQIYADGKPTTVMAFDAEAGTSKQIMAYSEGNVQLIGSPNSSLIIVDQFATGPADQINRLSFMDSSFNLREFVTLPPRTTIPEWSADGKRILFSSYARNAKSPELPFGTYSLELSGGDPKRIGDLDYEEPRPKPLRVVTATTNVHSTDARVNMIPDSQVKTTGPRKVPVPDFTKSWSLSGLVLISATAPDSAAIVSAEAEDGTLAPDLSAISYNSQGTVMVRPISRLDLSSYLTMKSAQEKQIAMMNAKQAVLALVMFSMDMDDAYPQQNGWADTVMPYIRDRNVLSSFNYTFAGGTIPEGKAAETVLGFVQGPGGRAVAYGDGHVVWEGDK